MQAPAAPLEANDGVRDVALDRAPGPVAPQGAPSTRPLSFLPAGLGPYKETVTGSFAPYDACIAVVCDVRKMAGVDGWSHSYDLSAYVPLGLVTRIEFTTEVPQGVVVRDLRVALVTPDGTVEKGPGLLGDGSAPTLRASYHHLTPGPVAAVVWYGNADTQPSLDYALHISVTPDAHRVAPGQPVGLTLAPGDETTLLPASEKGEIRFVLYAPDDSLYGRYRAENASFAFRLAAGAPSGEYVLVPTHGSVGFAVGESSTARLLGTAAEEGPHVKVQHEPSATWAWDVPAAPVRLGLRAHAGPGSVASGGAPLVAQTYATITSPAGIVFDGDLGWVFACVVCIDGEDYHWSAPPAHANLTAGEYTFMVRDDVGPNVEFWPYTVHWRR